MGIKGSVITLGLFSFIFSVANGEPPIGIPWETFQKYAEFTYSFMDIGLIKILGGIKYENKTNYFRRGKQLEC